MRFAPFCKRLDFVHLDFVANQSNFGIKVCVCEGKGGAYLTHDVNIKTVEQIFAVCVCVCPSCSDFWSSNGDKFLHFCVSLSFLGV